ncbi:hypothetical protein A2369_03180 [candidate division WS6 bacterium RIFOXYB1_FULL_33_15]|nr:MAG: hypothetical protein A2369_03180 [candidate division WS6 bacterium RIFOXYB1_FULL_33_15]
MNNKKGSYLYDILEKDIKEKEREIEANRFKWRIIWIIVAIILMTGATYFIREIMPQRDSLQSSFSCDDGYQWASDYEISNQEECKTQFEEGEARECCEVFVLEDFGNSEDYFTNNGYFKGYECTEDCSGHEAGYSWAEENGIESKDYCTGNSQSFIEGCYSYVEENF